MGTSTDRKQLDRGPRPARTIPPTRALSPHCPPGPGAGSRGRGSVLETTPELTTSRLPDPLLWAQWGLRHTGALVPTGPAAGPLPPRPQPQPQQLSKVPRPQKPVRKVRTPPYCCHTWQILRVPCALWPERDREHVPVSMRNPVSHPERASALHQGAACGPAGGRDLGRQLAQPGRWVRVAHRLDPHGQPPAGDGRACFLCTLGQGGPPVTAATWTVSAGGGSLAPCGCTRPPLRGASLTPHPHPHREAELLATLITDVFLPRCPSPSRPHCRFPPPHPGGKSAGSPPGGSVVSVFTLPLRPLYQTCAQSARDALTEHKPWAAGSTPQGGAAEAQDDRRFGAVRTRFSTPLCVSALQRPDLPLQVPAGWGPGLPLGRLGETRRSQVTGSGVRLSSAPAQDTFPPEGWPFFTVWFGGFCPLEGLCTSPS